MTEWTHSRLYHTSRPEDRQQSKHAGEGSARNSSTLHPRRLSFCSYVTSHERHKICDALGPACNVTMGPAQAHGHSGRKAYDLTSSQSNTKLLHDMRTRAVRLTYAQFFLTGNAMHSKHRRCNVDQGKSPNTSAKKNPGARLPRPIHPCMMTCHNLHMNRTHKLRMLVIMQVEGTWLPRHSPRQSLQAPVSLCGRRE